MIIQNNVELSLLWGAAAVDAAEYSFCMFWGSYPCRDWMDLAVALFPWGTEAGAFWQLELALWRCKIRRAEGEMSPVRAAGEEISGRVTLFLVMAHGWLVCMCCPMSPWLPTPQNQKWQPLVHTTLVVCEPRHVAGVSLFFLSITLFVPGSVSGSAKLSLYPHCVLST